MLRPAVALGFALSCLFASCVSFAAPTVEILLGRGAPGTAGEVVLNNPFGVIRAPDRTLWWCEYDGHVIRKQLPDGRIVPVAGMGEAGYTGDGGAATLARLNQPHEIRLDADGNCFVTDMKNHAIRRIDARTGIISTVAGTGTAGYSGDDGAATNATLRQPHSLQFDPAGNLFICDTGNHAVRRIDRQTGVITTVAGTGRAGVTPDDGPVTGTPLNGPRAIDFEPDGTLWLATREGNQLFRLDLKAGRIRRVAGTGQKGPSGDGGPAMDARLTGPKGLALLRGPTGSTRVILVDTESHTLRAVDAGTGRIERILGSGSKGGAFNPDPLRCELARPHGVGIESDGSLLVGDSENHRLLRLRP